MTYLTSVASGIADGGSTTHDSPNATTSGVNKCMWVLAGCSDSTPAAPSGVVWDPSGANQALTLLGSAIAFGTFANASLWRLIAPANATAPARITWAAAKGERLIIVWIETDIDQTTPNGTVSSANNTNSTVSAGAVTTTAGQRVIQFGHALKTAVFSGPTEFDSPTGTERQDGVTSGTAYDAWAAQEQTASGSSTTPTWTLNESIDGWASFAFALNVAAADTLMGQQCL